MFFKMLKKRGQVTAFMIVGIIILFSAALIIYLKPDIIFPEKIPEEVQPIKTYVESCMNNLAEEAVFILGSQGGYVELPVNIAEDPTAYVGGTFKIPYWYYEGNSRVPSKEEVAEQISNYIDSNLEDCLLNFTAFKEMFDISVIKEQKTTIQIVEENINVKTDYPLIIKQKIANVSTRIDTFSAEIPIRLGKVYDLAKEIMQQENEKAFLEDLTMDLIADSEFPNEGMELTCDKRSWSIDTDIVPALKLMLISNFRYLGFEGTDYRHTDNPYYHGGDLKKYLIKLPNKKFDKIRVDTLFDRNWNIIMDVEPSKNRVVKSVDIPLSRIGSCIQLYNHRYDITFPLLFQITDTTPNKEFTFSFATPVIIRNSEAQRERYFAVPTIVEDITSKAYCDGAQYPLAIYAIDDYTNFKINNASIQFQCVRFMCGLGNTEVQMMDDYVIDPNNFLLETELPACSGGILIGEKEGYLRSTEQPVLAGPLTINGREELYSNYAATIRMIPLKKLDYSIKVIEIDGGSKRNLKSNEKVVINLRSSKKDYDAFIVYPSTTHSDLRLMLGDYSYSLSIKLIEDDKWVGGLDGNWTVNARDLESSEFVEFNVIRKSEKPETEQQFADLWGLVNERSKDYMPILK